jgi:LAO/AO transport system kinase
MQRRLSLTEFTEGIKAGDRLVLSRAITLMESTRPVDQELAQQVLEAVLPFTGNSFRVGITGVPGVGKSTFIEAFGKLITSRGQRLAVLAIDPSSQRTGGSILGDKTRMETLSADPLAYIRPSPAGRSLGGVTIATRQAMLLCEAAGFDAIFIETVGVGQSETAVHGMVDFFLLLMLAGAGDELQGIKRGIMEMADAVAITKADGANAAKAQNARIEYQNALHLYPAPLSGWHPRVLTCSALENSGLSELLALLDEYLNFAQQTGYLKQHRSGQQLGWLHEAIRQKLDSRFFSHPNVKAALPVLEKAVKEGSKSAFSASEELLRLADLTN